MKKKVIGSSILLLVLLLGLSTTCYALSESQVENWVYNWYVVRKGRDPEATQTFINNNKTTFQQLATISETYNTFYIGEFQNRDDIIQFQWNTGNGGTMYSGNTTNIMASEIYNWHYLQLSWFNNNYNIGTDTTTYRFTSIKADVSYNKRAVVKSPSDQTITYQYNTCRPSNWLDGPYVDTPPTYFEFDMNEYSSTQYVNVTFNGTTYNNVPVYYKPSDTSQVLIGTLLNTEPATLKEDFFGLVYWNGSSWVTRDIQERDLNTFVYSSPFLSIQSNSDMTEYTYGQQPRFAAKDCFYFYSIDDVDYNRAYALWYIGSSHTIISGDKIDPSTFNDYPDYDDNVKSVFNNIDNIDNIAAATEPILDTLTDDEQVSGELSGLISGDASDIASRFGYSPVENPFTTVILDVMTDMTDILLGSGDQTLNFGFGGKNIIIHSSDFVLPSNRITNFLHLLVNGFFIWGIYKYGFTLYQWINSGRLQNLVNETNRHQYYLF